jgi:hypothetical protein
MLEKLLSLFAGIGLAVLLIIAASGNLSSQKQEVKAATETAIATTEKSEATTAEKSEADTEEVFSNGNTKDTINMNTVTDFEVDGNTLIIYTNDGSAYEWER